MWLLNRAVAWVLDALLSPFRGLPPAVGLAFISLLAGVGVLLVFRATSDQTRLAATKRRIQAAILEMRLFNEDLGFVLAAQREALLASLTYLRLTFVPMLWTALPLVVLMAHLQTRYGYRGLEVGETVIVKARLAEGVIDAGTLSLMSDGGVVIETPLLWIPGPREADWRIAAVAAGEHQLRLSLGGAEWTKAVRVSGSAGRVSARRSSASLLDQLLYPSEPPLPRGAAVVSIDVAYSTGDVGLLGWDVHWSAAFMLLTLVAALALRGPLRVTL